MPAKSDLKTRIRFRCLGSWADFTVFYLALQTGQAKWDFFKLPHFLQVIILGSIKWICERLAPCLAVEIFLFGVAAMVIYF